MVFFTDSLKRRQNANGKNIYHFAIYKCSDGHSWDKVINIFKATPGLDNADKEQDIKESKLDIIELNNIRSSGYKAIVIVIKEVSKKLRVDKLLSHQINDISRSEVESAIKNGLVLIDGKRVKNNTILRSKNIITIKLEE